MRRAILGTLAVVGAAVATASPAGAWDYPGHRMVGAIADFVLSAHHPEAYKKIVGTPFAPGILSGRDADGNLLQRTLSDVAVFPDCAKAGNVPYCGRTPSAEEKAYSTNNPNHSGYHFTDIPIQQTKYDPNSKILEKYDVVKMINYAVAQLQKKSPQMDDVKLSDTEAVWLLAHLVGDIHQPLHVGALYYDKETCKIAKDPTEVGMDNVVPTVGGNNILLVSSAPPPAAPPHDKLHLYWDGTVVNNAMKAAGWPGAEQDFARLLAASPPAGWKPKQQDPATWATEWATEIMPLAKGAHTKLKIVFKERRVSSTGRVSCFWTTTIPASYATWASQQARVQLAKGGFRLAALLAEIFKD